MQPVPCFESWSRSISHSSRALFVVCREGEPPEDKKKNKSSKKKSKEKKSKEKDPDKKKHRKLKCVCYLL